MRIIKIILFACLLFSPRPGWTREELPDSIGWVNDFAGVISPADKERIDALVIELAQKTTVEIGVVTRSSIAPYSEAEYAQLLFDHWRIGKKGKDNGVLILLAVKERGWRIHTGYGVEGILPDGVCGQIGRSYMVPYFKEGQYSTGLYYGVAAVADVISRDANATLTGLPDFGAAEKAPGAPLSVVILFLILLIFMRIVWSGFFRPGGRRGGGYRSGGFGGGGFGGGGFSGGGFGGGSSGGGGAGGRF